MQLTQVCRLLRNLDMSVLVLSKTQAINNEEGMRVREPMLQGKNIKTRLPGYFNVVGYIYRASGEDNDYERRILFRGPADFTTKDHPRLGKVEPANLTHIINKIQAPKKEEQVKNV